MAMLENPKHEQFAVLVAGGMTATEAYVRAGYSRKTAQKNAARFTANEGIKARVAELHSMVVAKAIDLTAINEAYVLAGIAEMTERCMQHRPVLQDGKPVMVDVGDGKKVAAAYRFDPQGAARGYYMLGQRLNLWGGGPRLPGGMNGPIGSELGGGEGGTTVNNTQVNVFTSLNEGGLQAVRSHIRQLRGLDKGSGLRGVPSLPRTD